MTLSVPHTPKNYLDVYDRDIVKWFMSRVNAAKPEVGWDPDDPESNKAYWAFAPADRAFSEIRRYLDPDDDNTIVDVLDDKELGELPLPIVSIARVTEAFDPVRYTGRQQFENMGFVDSDTKIDLYSARFPLPYTFDYQFDVWTDLFQHQNNIKYQVLSQFDPMFDILTVNLGEGRGNKYARLEIVDLTDNSDLESGTERSMKRFTYTIRLYGHLWRQITSVKSVLEIRIDWRVPDTEEDWQKALTGDTYDSELVRQQVLDYRP